MINLRDAYAIFNVTLFFRVNIHKMLFAPIAITIYMQDYNRVNDSV